MPAYWVARSKINDPVQYKKYTDPLRPIFDKYGGKVLARGGRFQIIKQRLLGLIRPSLLRDPLNREVGETLRLTPADLRGVGRQHRGSPAAGRPGRMGVRRARCWRVQVLSSAKNSPSTLNRAISLPFTSTSRAWPGSISFVFATFTKSAISGSCAMNTDRTNTLAVPIPWSSAAKCLVHDLIGPRRIGIAAEHGLVLVRHGEHRQQILEG